VSLVRNIIGHTWCIDNHVVDSPEAEELRRLFREGWICLIAPDTVLTEQLEAQDEVTRERLLEQLSEFTIQHGPIILGHSVLGFSVSGSHEDEMRIQNVHKMLWPSRNLEIDRRNVNSIRMARNCFRDTLIAANAIRYAVVALVTNDKGILKARDRLRKEFNGFDVMSISEATALAFDEVRSARKYAELEPNDSNYHNLPDWPYN